MRFPSVPSRNAILESSRRNSEALVAMGLVQHLTERWDKINQDYLASNRRASDAAGGLLGWSQGKLDRSESTPPA
jgi:ABC-type protease/lipase transport system fused ATPase/permease subunit